MRYQLNLLIILTIIGILSFGFIQSASSASVSIPTSSIYPYDAEITGDSVYVRTGPGTAFYEFGKLYKGDKVRIMGERDGVWSMIQPLKDSFSWISAQYVEVSPTNRTIGTVTGDNVRVWAGSPLYNPERSTTPQGKLNKGDKVTIIGEPMNNYYKIAVPSLPDAYYWVSTEYTKPIPKENTIINPRPQTGGSIVGPVVGEQPGTSDIEGPNPVIPTESSIVDLVIDENLPDMSDMNDIEEIKITPLDKYYVLQKQVEEERSKPLAEQDYSGIKTALKEIVDDKEADKASIYAQSVLDRIAGIELALGIEDIVKQQNEAFNKSKESIEKAYNKKLEEVQNLGKYAVIGTLQNSLVFGSGNYLVVDDSGKTICYAAPVQSASGKNFDSYVDKKVGLIGTIEPYQQTSSAIVRFSEAAVLK